MYIGAGHFLLHCFSESFVFYIRDSVCLRLVNTTVYYMIGRSVESMDFQRFRTCIYKIVLCSSVYQDRVTRIECAFYSIKDDLNVLKLVF